MPLAAVLWNGGISFGGVIAFLFADLIMLPILDIYRKYLRTGGPAMLRMISGSGGHGETRGGHAHHSHHHGP